MCSVEHTVKPESAVKSRRFNSESIHVPHFHAWFFVLLCMTQRLTGVKQSEINIVSLQIDFFIKTVAPSFVHRRQHCSTDQSTPSTSAVITLGGFISFLNHSHCDNTRNKHFIAYCFFVTQSTFIHKVLFKTSVAQNVLVLYMKKQSQSDTISAPCPHSFRSSQNECLSFNAVFTNINNYSCGKDQEILLILNLR